MNTDIESTDERPLSTIVQGNFLAYYHELSEDELDASIQTLTSQQVKMLHCAARGMNSRETCKQLGIKRSTLTVYLKGSVHFHDAYYTMMNSKRGFTASNIKAVAHGHALDTVQTLSTLANSPFDDETKPARLAVQVNAGKEILEIAGLHPSKNTGSGEQQVINIGQLLVNLSKADGEDLPQWKR